MPPGPFKDGGNPKAAGCDWSKGEVPSCCNDGSNPAWGWICGWVEIAGKFDGGVITADEEGVFEAMLVGGMTGGVDDPNREGIEIDEREDVDETGEGIAVTLLVETGTVVVVLLVVGANKFDIVGECFLLEAVVVVFEPPLGDVAEGDEAIDCFAFGEDNDVAVLVLVEGILLFTVVDATGALPFGIVAVALVVWPLFCSDPTWFGNDVRCVLRGSLVTCVRK